ncbi:MAG: hypothetical protein HY352_05585 [Candidatus Omnitrophica bacterium]|nr:hypothetical protein [Candidatus Omnitrophota bacterium]
MMIVSLGVSVVPASVWAACNETPLFSSASTQDVMNEPKVFVVSARKPILPGCTPKPLWLTVAGLEGAAAKVIVPDYNPPGQVSATIVLEPDRPQVHSVVYTVTEAGSPGNTVTLPVRYGKENATPVLGPIGDLTVHPGRIFSFAVSVMDTDGGLLPKEDGLSIDGLPDSARVTYKRSTPNEIVAHVEIVASNYDKGIRRVVIRGKDKDGGIVLGEMRLKIAAKGE